jgi:O-antigen/teichoic acid export membrane protein
MALASIANFIFSATLVKIKFKTNILPFYELKLLRYIIGLSIPFALFAVLQRLYMYLDSILLSTLAGDKYVGLYQIAFKIIFALQFLPMAFMASLYPAFALYYKENKEQLSVSFERAINYLLIISVPISLGIFAIADKIILMFKPEYIEAIWPLRIVILSLTFIFVNFPIGAMLNACDRQKINTRNMALILFSSIVLNLFLIPRYQALGASITVLVTNILMFILGIFIVPTIVKIRFFKLFTMFSKVLFSGFLMFAIVVFLKDKTNIFINIAISAIIYIGVLFLVGGFKKDDIMSVFKSFQKEKQI